MGNCTGEFCGYRKPDLHARMLVLVKGEEVAAIMIARVFRCMQDRQSFIPRLGKIDLDRFFKVATGCGQWGGPREKRIKERIE